MLVNLSETEISQVSGGDYLSPGIGSLIPGLSSVGSPTSSFGSFLGFLNAGDRDPRQANINAQLANYIAAQKAEGVSRGQAYADFFLF